MAKESEKELALNEAPRWTVEPVFTRLTKKEIRRGLQPTISHYSLRYDGISRDKGTTEREVERLREMAKLFNSRNARPADVKRSGLQLDMFPADQFPDLTPAPRPASQSPSIDP